MWFIGKTKEELLGSLHKPATIDTISDSTSSEPEGEEEGQNIDLNKLWSPLTGLSNEEVERWECEGQ